MIKRAILCVDDEKIVLDSIRNEIKSSICCDITVEVAQSAEEAIEIFNELIHDGYDIPLVISDYIMPEMKGDEFLKLINILSSSTYKILLTGQATIEGVTNAINYANLYRYIGKPWEKHDFSMTINEAIKSYEKDIELEKEDEI